MDNDNEESRLTPDEERLQRQIIHGGSAITEVTRAITDGNPTMGVTMLMLAVTSMGVCFLTRKSFMAAIEAAWNDAEKILSEMTKQTRAERSAMN